MQLRHNFCFLAVLFASSLALETGTAQTLTQELIAEGSAKLASDARSNGDIVRGAILFHQGNINCVKCHRPSAEQQRIGPNLRKLGAETSDESIVDSILQPSKEIKKEYASVVASTLDGRLVTGLQVSRNEQELVVRDRENVDLVIKIPMDNIDEIKPSKTSNMPDDLVNQLKNRQQFLDLLRYVIDIKERGPNANAAAVSTTVRRELEPKLEGLILIQKLNCVACHKTESLQSVESTIAPKRAPRLQWSSKWINPKYMERFIASPHDTKPGTTMPDMFNSLDEVSRQKRANAITHFLISKTTNQFQPTAVDDEAVSRGLKLFHSVGCVACHATRNDDATELELVDSLPLGDLAGKYNVAGLVDFLENPLIARPSGHMPNMRLTHREAVDVASYLLQSAPQETTAWQVDNELARAGEKLFAQHNCIACHADIVKPADEVAKLKPIKPLNQVATASGCLASDAADANKSVPDFRLSDKERAAIVAALGQLPLKLSSQQQIEVSLKALNCIACHDRGDLGGVSMQRNPHFKTTNLNLGDQGRIPPTLTGVGAKLNPPWMRDVMVNQRSIRPYMQTRMPQYGESNISHLLKLFAAEDKLSKTEFATFKDQKETRKHGMELAGNRGLNCVACHTYKYKLADTMPAVDLTEMAERLKKEWFYQYMLDPQSFSQNTVMPSFWPGGNAIRKDLPGTPEDQIEALWQYLIDGRQARMPRGVVREPLEIVVTDEAKMLRRSYPEIGKRGIGVGYPGGVNITYDAEQMRLNSIWQGKFVDPGEVWTGQGSGLVKAIGPTTNFPKGPELDHQDEPWLVDDNRPPNHQFQGYWLDSIQRPTFRYTFCSIEVEDFFSEDIDDENESPGLRRRLRFTGREAIGGLRFCVAESKNISADPEDKQLFTIGPKLSVLVKSQTVAKITSGTDMQRLEVPFDMQAGQTLEIVIEYRWNK